MIKVSEEDHDRAPGQRPSGGAFGDGSPGQVSLPGDGSRPGGVGTVRRFPGRRTESGGLTVIHPPGIEVDNFERGCKIPPSRRNTVRIF